MTSSKNGVVNEPPGPRAEQWSPSAQQVGPDGDAPLIKRSRRLIARLQAIAFLLGAGLLIFIINRIGVEPIFDALRQIGFGFFALLGIIAARHTLRTLAMRTAIPPHHRHLNFAQAFFARIGGEAVTFLTFTGPLLGEATKAALLKKRVPLGIGVPALIVDNLLYNLSVALFILSGACVMLFAYDMPRAARYTVVAVAAVATLALAAALWAVQGRKRPLTSTLDALIRLKLKADFLAARRVHMHRLESNVYGFYRHRRGAFFAMFGYDLLAHIASVTEVYVTLRMLGFDPRAEVPYIIESLTKVISFVFGFVPATIGVYEGGTGVILHTLGLGTTAGVTLALVRKAGMICWAMVGLGALAWRAVPSVVRRTAARHRQVRRAMDNLVFSNIAHRPARTFVSVLGVAVGVLLVVFTVGLAHGILRERGRREAGVGAEIMVRASGTFGLAGTQPFNLDVSHADEVAQIPGVRLAVPIGTNALTSDSGFGVRVVDGVPFEQYAELAKLRMIEGRPPATGADEAIVDAVWLEQRKARIGDTVQLYDRPFRIVGVYEPPGGGRVKILLSTMQEQVGAEGRATTVLVAVRDPAEQEEVAARILEKFPDDQIIFTRDLPELYSSSVPALNVFISVVVAVAAAISMLVILLAMYTTVTERTRQIGILKSLGMSSASIAWVVEQEAIVVSVLGVILGFILTLAARFAVTRATNLTIEIEPRWVFIALLIGLLGGTIGALYPALRAARQDVVEALSYE